MRDPILAGHLQRIAKDRGIWYTYLAELRDAETKRQQLAAIRYGSAEHDANPFRKSDPTLQAEFVRNNPPEVVEFCRAESRPLRLPFSPASKNLTIIGSIAAHNPTAGRIVSRAEQLERTWIESEVADARKAEQAAASRRKQVEELLTS